MGNENKPIDPSKAHVDTAQWLCDAELARLFDVLQQAGEVRFVGGAVRDALLGMPYNDLDLATTALPETVMKAGVTAGFKMLSTGLGHGTVTAVLQRGMIEITTLRRDVETDGRHATVAFTDDWAADAGRRDFTINALSATRDGKVFDYFGGLADLAGRRIRFIGDAGTRIREDYLRAFRLFRFSGRYAKKLDPVAVQAVANNLSGIKALSGERIASEIFRVLTGSNATAMWRGMIETGLMAACLPHAMNANRMEKMVEIETELALPDALRRFRATMPDGCAWLGAVSKRLKLSTSLKKRLAGAGNPELVMTILSCGDYAEALYRNDRQIVIDTVLLAAASGTFPRNDLPKLLADMMLWIKPIFPLGGNNLMELGLKPGPIFSALLREVEEWWIAQRFRPTRQECFEELKRIWKIRKHGQGFMG